MFRPAAALGVVLMLLLPLTATLAEEAVPSGQAAVLTAESPEGTPASGQPVKAANGQDASRRGGFATNSSGDYGVASGGLVNTAIGLVIVLAMIIAVAFLLKRFGGLPVVRKGAVSIVGGISLGPRERAVLLQVGDTQVLVGVAPGQVRALHVFDKDEVVDKEEKEAFSRQLDGVIKGAE